MRDETAMRKVLVWDLPVRLFHWTLVILVGLAWYSVKQGGNWMSLHLWCGYGILVLVSFRLLWGVVGSTHARFADFVRGPFTAWRYLRGSAGEYLGHNPLGGWSVLTLLALLLLQAGSGLFADDEIFTRGPLYHWVGGQISSQLTGFHKLHANILLGFIALHIGAIVFYRLAKGENLLHPMLSGYKKVPSKQVLPASRISSPWLALVILGVCAAAWYGLLFVRF